MAEQRRDVIRADDLGVSYGRTVAVGQVSFAVREGGVAVILGPNGAGKTSLMKALAGLIMPSAGAISLLDESGRQTVITRVPAQRRVRRGISLVPEGRGVIPGLSVKENLLLGRSAGRRQPRHERQADFERIFALFPKLAERSHQACQSLSGGEMQMLAIGRALLARPRVLLLDEPSLGLAPLATQAVYDALSQLNRQGLTLILVEQKAVMADWVPALTLVMRRGEIIRRDVDARTPAEDLARLYLGDGGPAS